jgi:hypothetical protein
MIKVFGCMAEIDKGGRIGFLSECKMQPADVTAVIPIVIFKGVAV